jgi:hypothetical protein
MKKIIGYLITSTIFTVFFATFQQAHAQIQTIMCNDGQGINTAIGCLGATTEELFPMLFSIALGIGGGIAFLMLIIGGIQIQISAGDPKRMQQGREIIEGAIIGLLLIILAFVILRIIGVDILGIPGFS